MLHLIEIEKEKRRRHIKKIRILNDSAEFYKTHPLEFFEKRLGIKPEAIDWSLLSGYRKHKWDGSINPLMKVLNALVNNSWAGVESATGTGKTFLGALIVFWFLECFDNALVVITAPKQEQLSLHIWKEIGKLFNRFGRGELTQLKLRISSEEGERMAVGFVAGIKADEECSTRAQGFHSENMLIILEETPGIPLPLINALQNTCTAPHNLILAFGNPDNTLDNLHQFCLQEKVEHIILSAYDHPNVVLNNPSFIPGAASLAGIQRIENRFGKNHPLTLSRTRGISPGQSVHSLIRLDWIKNAVQYFNNSCSSAAETPEENITGVYALGVDAANSEYGDKAAIALGKGECLLSVTDFQCPDSNQLGKVEVYSLMEEKGIAPEYVGVDGIGVGAGTVNALKELGLQIENIKGSEAPLQFDSAEEFNNLRSQMWWQMREDLRLGKIGIVNDSALIADLIAPKWFVRNGNIIVEGKEEIKKRLGRSPNKGDAAVYWNWVRTERKQKAVVTAEIL
jgi:phage terminase large subunit